jgi:hypothetical protein
MLKWHARQFKAVVIKQLVENAAIVGEFVESEARQRLQAIEEPSFGSFGKPYRQNVVARLLTNVVEEKPDEVDILVGVAKSSSSDKHGLYIELGTKKDAPHPFLRPAVMENKAKILALLTGQ